MGAEKLLQMPIAVSRCICVALWLNGCIHVSYYQGDLRQLVESELEMARNKIDDITKRIEDGLSSFVVLCVCLHRSLRRDSRSSKACGVWELAEEVYWGESACFV